MGPALRPILDSWQVSLVSVSEVDVSVDSRASWAAEWKRHGWHVQLSAPEHGVCRVALLSRSPFKAVKVCEAEGLTRHAAALVDLQVAGRTEVVLCVAAYLQSGQPDRAEAQAKDLIVSADYCGRPSLLFGDWNTTQEEGFIAEAIQRGMVHACDTAARGEDLPPTGPPHQGVGRRRRIDYGLTLRDFLATEVFHVPEVEIGALSDHRVVVYQFEGDAPDTLTSPPRRRTPHPDPCDRDFVFPGEAEARFRALLAEDLDGAWSYLSDWAEHLLFEPAEGAQVPRSQLWDPERMRRRRDTDHELDQSPGLRALRRLLRKLQVCVHRPWDGALTSKCQAACGKARAFFPGLPRLRGSLEAAQMVEKLVAEESQRERNLHLQRWRERMDQDLGAVRSYVKRRAAEQLAWEQELPDLQQASGGWHPALAVREQAEVWTTTWTRPFSGNLDEIDAVLQEVPRPPPVDLQITIEADDLWRATSAMRGKAAGADGWLPTELLQLPEAWFRWAAQLWTQILRSGRVPGQWKRARVALLWKTRRRTRPITLLCSLWRAGTRVLQAQLGPWIASWADHTAAGGLPGTGVQSALMQIRKAMADGAAAFIQTDIKGYFDHIHLTALRRAMRHMRFPPLILNVLEDFYTGAERIYSLSGSLSPSWSQISCGVAQGCPLSPVLAATLSYIWSRFVINKSEREIAAIAYVDDRTLWIHKGRSLEALRTAMDRSSRYDRAFGFQLSQEKCTVTAPSPGPEHEALAKELGFKVVPDLEILGVRARFQGGWTLLNYQARKAILRAKLLGWVTRSARSQKLLLTSLVVPPFAWAAGFARPSGEDLSEIKNAIEHTFDRGFTAGFAKVCLYEALGWDLQPDFACDLGALRVLWKASILQPRWLDTVALCRARFNWRTMLPELPDVLRRLRWTVDFAACEVTRTDRAGRLRTLRPGCDSFAVTKVWLQQHYRQLYVARTGRVRQRLHRDEEGLAVGLDLPPPRMDHDYFFDGLHAAMGMSLRKITLSALGAGGSCWFYNAGGAFDEQHDRWKCLCGLRKPSRVHLLWACEATAPLRAQLQLPVDRCEERLLLRGVPEEPPPPPALAPQELLDDLTYAVETQLAEDPAVLFVASDGSEYQGVGAFSVVVHPGEFTCAMGNGDEDQSSFKQELLGFDFAAKAVCRAAAASQWARRVVFVLDCQSALSVVQRQGEGLCYLLKLVDSVKASLRALRDQGVAVTCVWVPSHGKRPRWQAPAGLCGDLLRALNDKADVAAGSCRKRRTAGGARETWWRLREEAKSWELRAILASASASEALHLELCRHGLRPRECAPPSVVPSGAEAVASTGDAADAALGGQNF